MRVRFYICCCLLLTCLLSAVFAIAPVSGGFITDTKDSVYVYWYHPDVNRYEISLLENNPEAHKSPAQVAGYYCMAQALFLPSLVYVSDISVAVYDPTFDPFNINQPYESLDLAIFHAEDDSLPRNKCFYRGEFTVDQIDSDGRLLISGALDTSLTGCRLIWCGAVWGYDNPAYPEVMLEEWNYQYYGLNKIGCGDGESYIWQDLSHLLPFRADVLSPFPLEYDPDYGTCTQISGNDIPAGFNIKCYGQFGFHDSEISGDSLITILPLTDIDSVSIISKYDGLIDDEGLTLYFNKDRILPVKLVGDYDTIILGQGAKNIILENLSGDSLNLNISLDGEGFKISPESIRLVPYANIELEITGPDTLWAGTDIRINMCEFTSSAYYPFSVKGYCIPDQTTAVIDDSDILPLPDDFVIAYPNPFSINEPVRFKTNNGLVRLEFYDILGRKVDEISIKSVNSSDIYWVGKNADGNRLASGMYMARIVLRDGSIRTKKVVLIR